MNPGAPVDFGRLGPIVLAAVAAIALAQPVEGQTVRGVISERDTYAPIDLATVTLLTSELDTLAQTITDDGGYFTFEVDEAGSYYLIASALGYRPVRSELVSLERSSVRIVEMSMAVRPVRLSGIDVAVDGGEPEIPGLAGTGFYDRMAEGWGDFLPPGAVARHPARYTSQLLREIHNVVLVSPGGGQVGPWSDRPMIRTDIDPGQLCQPMLWIDDVHIELMDGESLDDAAPREKIEAIEIFRAPFGPPLRYFRDNSPTMCGAILIWTKR